MNKTRVVITGMGVVSPLGNSVKRLWQEALQGTSGVRKINRFAIPDEVSSVAGLVEDYLPESADVFNNYSGDDRAICFAMDALNQALKQSGLDIKTEVSQSNVVSLALSSAVAAITSMEREFNKLSRQGLSSVSKSNLYANYSVYKFNHIVDYISRAFEINGRSLLLPTGCAGCLDALSYSVQLIRDGLSDVVISGASEAPITPLVVSAFNKIGATSKKYNQTPDKASRPFDKDRDGFVLAEGCGILILESLEHALSRGAAILAEIAGVGSSNNCYHMTNIPEDGLSIANACQQAFDDAGILPDEIDHINAHGSSTPQNDVAETNAFKRLFGKRYNQIPVTSNKSFLGHALAASNALETILSVQSLNDNLIPPTINLFNQDERCDIDVVADRSRKHEINTILKNSSGFSGIHSSIVMKKWRHGNVL